MKDTLRNGQLVGRTASARPKRNDSSATCPRPLALPIIVRSNSTADAAYAAQAAMVKLGLSVPPPIARTDRYHPAVPTVRRMPTTMRLGTDFSKASTLKENSVLQREDSQSSLPRGYQYEQQKAQVSPPQSQTKKVGFYRKVWNCVSGFWQEYKEIWHAGPSDCPPEAQDLKFWTWGKDPKRSEEPFTAPLNSVIIASAPFRITKPSTTQVPTSSTVTVPRSRPQVPAPTASRSRSDSLTTRITQWSDLIDHMDYNGRPIDNPKPATNVSRTPTMISGFTDFDGVHRAPTEVNTDPYAAFAPRSDTCSTSVYSRPTMGTLRIPCSDLPLSMKNQAQIPARTLATCEESEGEILHATTYKPVPKKKITEAAPTRPADEDTYILPATTYKPIPKKKKKAGVAPTCPLEEDSNLYILPATTYKPIPNKKKSAEALSTIEQELYILPATTYVPPQKKPKAHVQPEPAEVRTELTYNPTEIRVSENLETLPATTYVPPRREWQRKKVKAQLTTAEVWQREHARQVDEYQRLVESSPELRQSGFYLHYDDPEIFGRTFVGRK